MTDQVSLAIETEVARGSPAGHDQCSGIAPVAVDLEPAVGSHVFKILDDSILEPGTEFLSLLVHPHDEIGPIHSFRKPREILHGGGRRELTAGLPAFEDER